MNIRFWGAVVLSVAALSATMSELWSLGGEIEIATNNQKRQVGTENYQGQELLRLKDLAEIFSLQLRESNSSLAITGARGEILITDGRPLVRSGDHYVLLSSVVWKRKEGDWYVPEDFLVKTLSNIISQKLERQPDGSFQLRTLRTNHVRVRMDSYPDHLSVIFEVSQKAPVEVREFRDYVEVAFTDFLVSPEEMASSSDTRLVSSVEFSEQESFGSFRIQKGSQFSSFRHHYLESPAKLIIEVFGMPSMGQSATDPAVPAPPTSSDPAEIVLRRTGGHGDVIVIDPGHGGVDYGVDAYQDLLEKVITLNIARRIETQLRGRGVEVRLTRARDVQLPREQRSAISNFYRCRLYIGLHMGGAPAESTRGPVVYIYSPPDESGASGARSTAEGGRELVRWDKGQLNFLEPSRQFATSLLTELNPLFKTENPVVAARLAVLAPVKAPAVIVETGFLTNSEDQEFLAAPGFQEQIADSITNAIIKFLR